MDAVCRPFGPLDLLRTIRPAGQVEIDRKALAKQLLGDVRRLDAQLAESKARIEVAVAASGTTVTQVHGVGPIVAALLMGTAVTSDGFAPRITTPATTRPRRSRRPADLGHVIGSTRAATVSSTTRCTYPAVTQVGHDTPGRVYYQRKLAEHKSKKEALRALERRVSDAVYRQLIIDANSR